MRTHKKDWLNRLWLMPQFCPDRGGRQRSRTGAAILTLALLLTACAYQPGGIDNPITRKFSWFSYVGAEDLKRSCRPGQLDHYRLIYNANYDEHVRAYDIRQSATGVGAMLFARVFGGGGNIISFDPTDPTGPWRGASSEASLTAIDYQQLARAINDSGFWDPAPRGLQLRSDQYYWVGAACVNGRFHFNAWLHPSDRFQRLRFLAVLLPFDRTGVAVKAPEPVLAVPPQRAADNPDSTFTLRVGDNGLVGHLRLF